MNTWDNKKTQPYRVGLYNREHFLQYISRDYKSYLERIETNDDVPLARVKEELARKEGRSQPDSVKLRTMYNKGALVAAVLDEEIKERTDGKKALDDVMHYVFQKFKRYSSEDILEAINTVTGQDFLGFFLDFVYGSAKLPMVFGGA